jgi:hypothetical protein
LAKLSVKQQIQSTDKFGRENDSQTNLKQEIFSAGVQRVEKSVEPQPQVYSAESSFAPYETLFHDFDLEAIPFYNFWTDDETTNDREARGDRDLQDIPRFIKVVWNPVSDVPRNFDDKSSSQSSPSFRNIDPIKFGLEKIKTNQFLANGVSFTPDHMQPANFSLVKNSLANGYLAPGVIDSIVEVPLSANPQKSIANSLDEESFLSHPDLEGLSLEELRSNIHQVTHGTTGAAAIDTDLLSRKSKSEKEANFDGKFSVGRSPFGGGNLELNGVHSSSPTLSISSKTAVSSEGDSDDHVLKLANKISDPPHKESENSRFAKVKFVHPVIDGVISERKVNLMSRTEHAENMVAISQILPYLEVFSQAKVTEKIKKIDIPSFPSPPGTKSLEYVGYILEKYKKSSSGVFEKIEEIDLPNKDYSEYYDTKICYGAVYRYRIRCILRWTRPNDVGPLGKDTTMAPRVATQTTSLAPLKSSYFGSEWNKKWAYATVMDTVSPEPPDELIVRPDSRNSRCIVTMKIPENIQRDILQMLLFRKIQNENGEDLTGWQVLNDRDPGVKNVLFYDENLSYFQDSRYRYVYAGICITRHGEISNLSEQLGVKLNKQYKTLGEFPVEFVSCKNVQLGYFGAFAYNPPKRYKGELIVAPNEGDSKVQISFKVREAFGNGTSNDNSYFVKLESLDTGLSQSFPLDITYKNLADRQQTLYNHAVPQPAPVETKKTEKTEKEVQKEKNRKKEDTERPNHKARKGVYE